MGLLCLIATHNSIRVSKMNINPVTTLIQKNITKTNLLTHLKVTDCVRYLFIFHPKKTLIELWKMYFISHKMLFSSFLLFCSKF